MIGRLLGVAVPLAILTSALLLSLSRAGRRLRDIWTDWLDEGARRHKAAYAVLHPHLAVYGLWLLASRTIRETRNTGGHP